MKRALTLIVVLATAAPAWAAITPDVKKYLGSAAALFEKLEYEKALAQLKRAKAKSQGPEDDLRIALYEGIVLAEMGDSTAPSAFASALGMDPNVSLPLVVSPKVQKVFDKAKAQVQKVLEAEAAVQRQKDEEEARKREEARKKEEASRPAPPPVVAERRQPEPSRGVRRFWWAPAIVGVAGLATGATLLVMANADAGALRADRPMTREEALSIANRGANLQVGGWAVLSVGIVAAVAAVGLFVFGGPSEPAPVSASVVLTPSGGAAAVSVPLPF
ncbi:MAG: hypothetical protein JNK82_23465 [Myxococcaceae bacterium]|nr:hypothetical protein [Myxococcaceae bacterium]